MNTRTLSLAAGAMLLAAPAFAQSCPDGSANTCSTTIGAVSSGPNCGKIINISPPYTDPGGAGSFNMLAVLKPTDPLLASVLQPGATVTYQIGGFTTSCKGGGTAAQGLPFISYAE